MTTKKQQKISTLTSNCVLRDLKIFLVCQKRFNDDQSNSWSFKYGIKLNSRDVSKLTSKKLIPIQPLTAKSFLGIKFYGQKQTVFFCQINYIIFSSQNSFIYRSHMLVIKTNDTFVRE